MGERTGGELGGSRHQRQATPAAAATPAVAAALGRPLTVAAVMAIMP